MTLPIDELKRIVGRNGWTTDPAALEPHLTEWREVLHGATPIMLSPATTQEVAAIVKTCAKAGVGVVPQGGNTGLCGGAIPDKTGNQVLVSMSRMNAIRSIEPADYSIVVEAGCVLADVQAAAAAHNRLYPLSLAPEGSCQVGGNLATNAGGINVIRYGTARQHVLGLEVVLADGTVLDALRALHKDTAGYDLKQLFLGSEGTLGIITAAALRLFPVPANVATALIAVRSARAAVDLLAALRESLGDTIQAFELMSARAMRFVTRHIPDTRLPFAEQHAWYVLMDAAAGTEHAVEPALERALEERLAEDIVVAKNAAEATALWRIRHSISSAQKPEGASLKHDIALPIGELERFVEDGAALIDDRIGGARPVVFGHVGDGNLHYNITQPVDMDPERFREAGKALTASIYELVASMGGSISAEHGIGVLKKDALAQYRSAQELELMRTLKRALDPKNTLNPGKVI